MNQLLEELRTKIEADTKATIDSFFETRKDHERQELRERLRRLEAEHQEALEYFGLAGRPSLPQESSQKDFAVVNGSSGTPTRREMLDAVLPECRGTSFMRRDIDQKIFERWPEVEPRTEVETKNFRSAIAGLLSERVDRGELEAKKGKTRFQPTVYRFIDDDEDTLLKPEP